MYVACQNLVTETLGTAADMMGDLLPVFALITGLALVGYIMAMVFGWLRG